MSKRNGNGATLKLDPHNARKHPDRNKAQIAASLKELGAGRSILVDATDTIIAGNGVYEQAQALGYKVKVIEADGKTLIAVKRPDLKGAKARRMALADNRATETSEWDVDVLADLAANDAEALAGLFDERELRDLLGDKMPGGKEETADAGELVDKAAELQAKWQVERGDVWQVGRHRVMCGDSTNAADVATLMQGERAAIVLTDPPYSSGGFQETGKSSGSIGTRGSETIARDNLSTRGYRLLMGDVLGLFNSTDVLYLFTDWRMWIEAFDTAERGGWRVRNMLVWDKEQMGMGFPWRNQHELILFGKRIPAELRDGKRGNVIRSKRSGNVNHPTEKPVDVIGQLLNNTNGDICFDPFLGSGTTLVACEQTGRIGRGMEIEPKYVSVSLERLTALGLEAKRVTDTNGNGKTKATA